jgi:molybdopterin molybdotransferase
MTGAPVPAGADAVVPFEWTDRGRERVRVDGVLPHARHIRVAGEDVPEGTVAVPAGTVLAPRHLALLAAVGVSTVAVHPAPRLAVIATGEELTAGQVPDSNTIALTAAGRQLGAQARSFGPVPDDPDALRGRLAAAADEADLVVTTGGVSAGDHDVVKAALGDHPDFWFGSVAVKPGRPQGAGSLTTSDGRRVPVLCLPGTPVAAYSTFLLFAAPVLRALGGRVREVPVRAVLDAPVATAVDRTLLLPAGYVAPGRVAQLAGHVGHSQRLLAAADVLLVVPPGDAPLPAGDEVVILPLAGWDHGSHE